MAVFPAIVLVRPGISENVGSVARALKNFGFSDLRLVDPRCDWLNARARALSAKADDLLESARSFPSLKEALADCQVVMATAAKQRDMNKQVVSHQEAIPTVAQACQQGLKVALLFGSEKNGLENDELTLAHTMVTIPTAASFDSLNLSQAVLLLVSHLFMALRNPVVEAPLDMPAPYEEVLGFFDHLETALETHGYFRVHQKKQRMIRTIRSLFIRAQMSHQEVQTMRGVVESLINPNGIYSRPRRRKMIFSPDLMIKALTNSQD